MARLAKAFSAHVSGIIAYFPNDLSGRQLEVDLFLLTVGPGHQVVKTLHHGFCVLDIPSDPAIIENVMHVHNGRFDRVSLPRRVPRGYNQKARVRKILHVKPTESYMRSPCPVNTGVTPNVASRQSKNQNLDPTSTVT
jgi:hypothetical protein